MSNCTPVEPSGPSWPRPSSTTARSSRYWRQPEYDEYADVTSATAFFAPSASSSSIASVVYGSQLRLPHTTGSSTPRRASSASIAALSARFCSLMGLLPPKP